MGKLTVSYNNENIINTTNDGSFKLATKDKLMTDDISIVFESGGEMIASQKDVNLIDFDGTIRYSYTASEFASLTALPANPSHSGLTAQGWNWSLADAKAYVAKHGKLWIGQMYITDDGKTRVYIHLEEGRTSPMLGCNLEGTVVVDWGDGSATETLTGTNHLVTQWTSTHNYANAGDYVITLEVTNGKAILSGNSSSNQYGYLLRYSSGGDERNQSYRNAIQRVEIGENTSIAMYSFDDCKSLTSITIPNSVTYIESGAFSGCQSLTSITIPDGVTGFGGNALSYCYSLANIAIPNSVTSLGSLFKNCYSLASITLPDRASIGQSLFESCLTLINPTFSDSVPGIGARAFYSCESLTNITIPNTVTSIGVNAFYYCYSLAKIRFESTTPPTVANSNAWTYIPADCVIYVPERTMEAYTSAANYPNPATYKYVSTITVDDVDVLLAENGMTWQQWVDSDYNTIGAYIDENGFVRCNFNDSGAIDPYLRYFENPDDDIVATSTDVINFSPKDEDGNDTNWTWQ